MVKRVQLQRSETAKNGRGANGKFAPGNRIALGNSAPRKAARFRELLFRTVGTDAFVRIVQRLIKEAIRGQPWAVKLFLNYLLGDPVPIDIMSDLEEMKQRIDAFQKSRQL